MGMMLVRRRQQLEAEAAQRSAAECSEKPNEPEKAEVKKPAERRTAKKKN